MYIHRTISEKLKIYATKFPIITITGPRQSGKTTCARHIFSEYTYVNMELPDVRERVLSDPRAFLASHTSQTIFDEIQSLPEIFPYLKDHVDRSSNMGQYIILGSQNFSLLEHVSESLAGRTAILKILPCTYKELADTSLAPSTWQEYALSGSYPRIYSAPLTAEEFYPSYVETYLQRDVRSITQVHDLRLFYKFLQLCAGRTGQQINFTSMGNDIGVDYKTIQHWISILEACYVVHILPPYYNNFNKRLTKSPKLYFYDTGLVSYLLGIRTKEHLETHPLRGALFENMIISEHLKMNMHRVQLRDYYFWRDSQGHEIDLLNDEGNLLHLKEMKSGTTYSNHFLDELQFFQKNMTAETIASLIYGGESSFTVKNIKIKSWKEQLLEL